MEVVNERRIYLSNYEVLRLLQEKGDQSEDKSSAPHSKALSTVVYETVKYLQGTPCIEQTEESIVKTIEQLKKFNLSKKEILQILNLRPSTPLELQMIITEGDQKLSEDSITEILSVVQESLSVASNHSADQDLSETSKDG
ncbi:unnamed protein product [Soboliphyme baturini]|uniref:DNA-directed RNA polymerase III subunit RPC9 n=1 Tax=Soboliphyme baturini TaxID=241478 RepID=A0A183IUJ7_9BILA|nr:unnamed protein product [Soboliphyme baturini]